MPASIRSILTLPVLLLLLAIPRFSAQPTSDSHNKIDPYNSLELAVFNKSAPSFMLGGIFSFTSGGVVNEKGLHRAEAMKCAVERVNSMPDFLPGKTVYYEMVDDRDDAIQAVYKAMQLINNGHMAVVGASGSALTEAASKVLSSFNIPMVTYASSSASLSDIERYPTLLRTVASDSHQTTAMVSLAAKFGWSLVAAIGTDDTYGSSGTRTFLDEARQNSIKVACNAIVSARSMEGIVDFQNCLKRNGVKVVVVFTNEAGAVSIISSLYNANAVPSDMIFIASDSWSTSLVPAQLSRSSVSPSILAGTISTIQWPGDLTVFQSCLAGLNPENNNYPHFIKYWEQKFKCTTNSSADTPVCGNSISGRDGKCKCTGSESLANETPNNKVALVDDAVYAILNALHTLIHNCYTLPMELQSTCASPVLTSKNLLDAARALKFTGLSGEVAFHGVDRTSVSYSYIQYNGSAWNNIGSWVVSGNFSSKSNPPVVTIDSSALVWRQGFSDPPTSIIRPDAVLRTDTIAVVVKSLASVGLVAALAFAVYFLRAKDHAVIKRASPLFCVLMLFGMMLIYIDLYLWDGEMSPGMCISKVWVPLIGFGFVMGPMLVKTFRIYKIFETKRLRVTGRLQDAQLLGLSAVVVAGEIILLLVWTVGDPIHPVLLESTSADLYTTIKCQGNNPTFQTGMFGAFVAYNTGLLALGVVMSYKSRNVHSSFNESKYIAYAIYNISLCVAVLLPIYMTIGDAAGSSQREYIVRSLATLFANTACMLILFGPKFYQVYRDAKLEEYDSSGGGGSSSSAPPANMNRRGSSGFMFSPPPQRGRQQSVGKDEKGKKGGSNPSANMKIMKSVKAPIDEAGESRGGASVKDSVGKDSAV